MHYLAPQIHKIVRANGWPERKKSALLGSKLAARMRTKSRHPRWRIRRCTTPKSQGLCQSLARFNTPKSQGFCQPLAQLNTPKSQGFCQSLARFNTPKSQGFCQLHARFNTPKSCRAVGLARCYAPQNRAVFASRSHDLTPQNRRGFASRSNAAYLAVLGIGSNIPPEIWRLKMLRARWRNDPRVRVLATSALVINAAFGFAPQADFTNAAALVRTHLSPRELLKWALHEERVFHRERPFKNAPRTLDIDLIFASAPHRDCPRLRLPHPGAFTRLSVALPLSWL